TPALVAELDQVLERHELVKVKVGADDRDARDAMIAELAGQTGAALVQRIGHTATLYRPAKESPAIGLPRGCAGRRQSMQLSHERPDYGFVLRGADARSARVNDRILTRSFAITPDRLLEDWDAPASPAALEPAHLARLLDLQPELVVLGTGERQVF